MSKRISYEEVKATVKKALLNAGLSEEQAETCATVHASSSADGVESHGLNRVPRFVDYVGKGWINLDGRCKLVGGKGAVENYDGNLGIGIINAQYCMDRAIELAKVHGIGCVTLKNTTHWMRGGTYAWRAAEAGFMSINWINTESCMPAWGSKAPGIGNNPFCIGIPREDGPIVLDMAMSQYAYGKLGVYKLAGKKLPYAGGFDKEGNLTDDPAAIEESMRILPTGYWKGSGMAIALDMAAALMANGLSGDQIDQEGKGSCGNCCQVFIAYDPYLFGTKEEIQKMLNGRVHSINATEPEKAGERVTCPGERTMSTRAKSMMEGVQVDEAVWDEVCKLAE